MWGIPGLFTAIGHSFKFEESRDPKNIEGTTFLHEEYFTGILSLTLREGSTMHNRTEEAFKKFNRDLKARCEQK